MIDACVKSWQYFPTQITSLNSVSNSLSYDIVRFKIEVVVEEKFMCKNVTKQTQHGDRAVAAQLWPGIIFAAAQHTTCVRRIRRAESFDSAPLVLNGDNMLGLCDPSNLLFEYSFYPPRSDELFSNYFEQLFTCRSTIFYERATEQQMWPWMSFKVTYIDSTIW